MNRKVVITCLDGKIITAILENDVVVEIHCSSKELDLLNEATRDLVNGNYLGKGKNIQIPTIDIEEVKTLEGA